MLIFLVFLYVVAAVCSLWGAFGPMSRATREAQRGDRAQQRLKHLRQKVNYAHEQGDAAAIRIAEAAHQAEINEPFEGGPDTLRSLAEGSRRYTSKADLARTEQASRREGLGWIGVGVTVGSIASILSLWA